MVQSQEEEEKREERGEERGWGVEFDAFGVTVSRTVLKPDPPHIM